MKGHISLMGSLTILTLDQILIMVLLQEGIPLRLVLHVYDVEDEDGACALLLMTQK